MPRRRSARVRNKTAPTDVEMEVDDSIVEKPAARKSKRGRSSKSAKKSKESASKTESVSKPMEVEDDGDTEEKDESNPPTVEPSVDVTEMNSLSIDPSSNGLPPEISDDPDDDIKMDGQDDEDGEPIKVNTKPTVTVIDESNESKNESTTVPPVSTEPSPSEQGQNQQQQESQDRQERVQQRPRNRRGKAADNDDYLDLDAPTLAVTRSKRQRTKVSYRDDSSSEEEEESSEEDSEADNPLFAGLSKAERAAMKAKMASLQNEHDEQAKKDRDQALEEIVSSFEFNIGEKVTKNEAGFIHDFCQKHQIDVNDKIEDEGDFFLMSMREMIEERMMEIKRGVRTSKPKGGGKKRGGGDSESDFECDDYDDSDSEYDVDSDWSDPDMDNENLISDDEYGGFVVGGKRKKRRRKKNTWVDEDGREYHCKGRLLLDDALKDTENFEGWSEARVKAWKNKEVNPNAYYYRFNDPGEEQQNGRIREDEHKAFMDRVVEHGVNSHWGVFSKTIKGRVGYQCSNYWRQMMKDGWVKDPNYWIRADGSFQFKRAKKGSIPDEIRRFSFVVLHDPSKVFHPIPGSHPKRPSDAKLAKYLQTNVKQLSEKEKKGGKRGKAKKKTKKEKEEEAKEDTEEKESEKAEEETTNNKEEKDDNDVEKVEEENETTDNKEPSKKKKKRKSKKKSSKKKDKKSEDEETQENEEENPDMEVDGEDDGEDVKGKKKKKGSKKKKEKKSKKKSKSKKEKEDEDGSDSSKSDSKKKKKRRKRKRTGSEDETEPKKKKSKTSSMKTEEEEEDDPMAVLKGMTDMMTGEPMVKPTISPYGHVMEYDSWCSILRAAKTRNKCPFTQQKITRRQLTKLDASNIGEYADKIVNINQDQMTNAES